MNVTPLAIRLGFAVVLASLCWASGCACHGPQGGWCGHHGGQYFGGPLPVCFGFSSTCWHPWPAECVTCPTFAFPPEATEPLPETKPLPSPSDQVLPETPAPMPVVPMSDVLEPAVRPAAPALPPAPEPEEQAIYDPPPPVLTAAPIVTPASLQRRLPLIDERE